MNYIAVARWRKKDGNAEEVMLSTKTILRHWQEIASDVGMDPEENVKAMENEAEVRVGISQELDLTFREGGGSWQYY